MYVYLEPELIFVVSGNGYKFCRVQVINGQIILVFKKAKPKSELLSREVEVELMEFISYVLLAAAEFCRRTGQQYNQTYQKLTYRA